MLPTSPRTSIVAKALLLSALASAARGEPARLIDLAELTTDGDALLRVHGSSGDGALGVPIAGGTDCNADGFVDYAMASMLASPLGRTGAGEVFLVFGHGRLSGTVDTSVPRPDVLRIVGDGPSEATGSEIWMDDVTGDGFGDLLIARQNFRPDLDRVGAGALTILVGGPQLSDHAKTLAVLDLRSPPETIPMTTLVGADALDRLGMWVRAGDVDGDEIADVVVGADQLDGGGESHRGAAYVVRGGGHLATHQTVDLAEFGATTLVGHLARLDPPAGSTEHHFGATCQIADLDGNGRGEVLVAAALARAGGGIRADGSPAGSAHGSGGSAQGTLYIVWDDNFPAGLWPAGFAFDVSSPLGSRSILDGGPFNRAFGEEILGGLDFDGDSAADLLIGDLVGDASLAGDRPESGVGHVFYAAAALAGAVIDLDTPPEGLASTTIVGAELGALAADTVMQGDFDGDGRADLALGSPHASPVGRVSAGTIHVLHGQVGPWPERIDLRSGLLPPTEDARITEVWGARGRDGSDAGDTLCYSGAAGDVDGDGTQDLVSNEMQGNGLAPGTEDVGNLIVVSLPEPRNGLPPAMLGATLAACLRARTRTARRGPELSPDPDPQTSARQGGGVY